MPVDLDAVRYAVEASYRSMPQSTASWPNPHADTDEVPLEEYSRLTDPERYRVVGARVEAWVRALTALELADTAPAQPPSWSGSTDAHAVWLRPRADGAQPLLVLRRPLQDVPDCIVTLGVCNPAIELDTQPDCACDACDYGSVNLLAAVDDMFIAVVAADFVYASDDNWSLHTTVNGWSARGNVHYRDIDALVAAVRAGRSVGTHTVLGVPWSTGLNDGPPPERSAP